MGFFTVLRPWGIQGWTRSRQQCSCRVRAGAPWPCCGEAGEGGRGAASGCPTAPSLVEPVPGDSLVGVGGAATSRLSQDDRVPRAGPPQQVRGCSSAVVLSARWLGFSLQGSERGKHSDCVGQWSAAGLYLISGVFV